MVLFPMPAAIRVLWNVVSPAPVTESRIGCFLDALTDEIESQNRQKNRDAREQNQPPQLHILPTGIEQRSPARIRRRRSEAQKAQAAFNQDRRRDTEGDRYQNGCQ